MSTANTFALSVLAGAFIALGAIFATTVTAGGADVPFGVLRLLGGLAFSLGLILVIVAGAELFTGNNLIVMAWAGRRVRTIQVARNWTIVYLGNFVGALTTAGILFVGKQYEFGGGAVGVQTLSIAAAKTDLGFVQAIALGALCNGLVCLAVWLCYSARTTTDKILAIVPPIAAFVAAGFEHCVANMFFIPMGLLVKATRHSCLSRAVSGPHEPDVGALRDGESRAGDHREHRGWGGDGGRDLLVRVSAQGGDIPSAQPLASDAPSSRG